MLQPYKYFSKQKKPRLKTILSDSSSYIDRKYFPSPKGKGRMGMVVGFPTGLMERFWNRGSCYMTRMLNNVDGQLYGIYILQQ